MDVNQLIKKLAEKLNLPDLQFSDEGVVTLLINEQFNLNIEKSIDGLHLTIYGVLGTLPPIDREEHLLELATGNYFGLETEGSTLCVDQDTEEIILYKTLEVKNLHFDELYGEFQKFIISESRWIERLAAKEYVYVPKRIFPY